MQKLIFPLILSISILVSAFVPLKAASAMPPLLPADSVEFGEKIDSAGVLDFLVESGLIEVADDFIIPSIFLRMVSGAMDDSIPISDSDSWLSRLFGDDNELFYTTDGSGVVQEHNGVAALVTCPGDLWLTSSNMSSNTSIPFNYSAQYNGDTYVDNGVTYNPIPVCLSGVSPYGVTSFYVLPVCASGSNLYYGSQFTKWDYFNKYVYYSMVDSSSLDVLYGASSFLAQNKPNSGFSCFSDIGYSVNGTCHYRQSIFDYCQNPNGSLTVNQQGTLYKSNIGWRTSANNYTTLTSGDISYLIYTSEPTYLPADMPTDNYIYCDNPDDTSGAVVISPDGDYASLLDYVTNGFVFTGSVNVEGDFSIDCGVSLSGNLGLSHSGNITINFNDDLNIWSDDGKATDFGHGVSLDGNAFNDGFSWLLNGVAAVPVVLQQFTFIPSPVLSIIASALVVMVFLGLWRTFKGG